MKVFSSWSGGKESALATHMAICQGHRVWRLVSFVSEDGKRSRGHGVSAEILDLQAKALGIPLVRVRTSWGDYEENFKKVARELKEEGVRGGVFGDIDLEEHREWIERVCGELGMKAILPLWGLDSKSVLETFLALGFRARVVATRLDERLLGKDIDEDFLAEIQRFACHLCGEAGEYHTLVTDGPIFRRPLEVAPAKKERRDGVWFLDLVPQPEE
ncbi:MAG: diphthine--ammonia ligase [Dehalococcoidia bacterium]|nr:diphthine--ammonia ligase [Dehalococcoidia bacterium]